MMKKFLTFAAAAALTVAAVSACGNAASEPAKSALDVIKARTSIRSFTGEAVTPEQLNVLLDAAMSAPTAMNVQPWRFVVLQDKERIAEIFGNDRQSQLFLNAGAVIIVCGESTMMRKPWGQPDAPEEEVENMFWYEDCSAAAENLLLAATALDLGAVWIACYPTPKVGPISEALGLPAHVLPLCIIPVGVPAENPTPKDKWKPENIHYDRW